LCERRMVLCFTHCDYCFLVSMLSGSLVSHAQQKSEKQTSQPTTQKETQDAIIVLERNTDYFQVNPTYKITIYSDGSVTCEGENKVKLIGTAQGKISQQKLQQLIDAFKKINSFSLRGRYSDRDDGGSFILADSPTVHISLELKGKKKTVLHNYGCLYEPSTGKGIYPRELVELEYLIDEIVNSKQWIED
jgi:hypothetical protein